MIIISREFGNSSPKFPSHPHGASPNMTDANQRLVQRIFENAKFIHSLGIELGSFDFGWCETTVKVTPALQQQHGFVHAGVLMTLADHTCGGAAASTVPADKEVITVENKVSFLRPASGSILVCRAEVLRTGRNLVFVEAAVSVEDSGARFMVAKASSTLAVIRLDSMRSTGSAGAKAQ